MEEIQANTSQREINKVTRRKLKEKGNKSPDLSKMYRTKIGKSDYFYPTAEKREAHLEFLLIENNTKEYLFINPKK